jgi:hypothetical protein
VVGKRTKRDQLDYLVVEGRITLQWLLNIVVLITMYSPSDG